MVTKSQEKSYSVRCHISPNDPDDKVMEGSSPWPPCYSLWHPPLSLTQLIWIPQSVVITVCLNPCWRFTISCFQIFEWPVARPIEHSEEIRIQLLVHNKYFTNKPIGSYVLILQTVIENGRLLVADSLVDGTSKPIPVSFLVEFPSGVRHALRLPWVHCHVRNMIYLLWESWRNQDNGSTASCRYFKQATNPRVELQL